MANMENLKGMTFNRLYVYDFSHVAKWGHACWKVCCVCGGKSVVSSHNLKSGSVKACGCLHGKSLYRHGMYYTSVYKTWSEIKRRCFNKNCKSYKNYGGRGITISKNWLNFDNFYKDMGEKPKGKSLERINNNGNYETGNCRWANSLEQNNNKRNNVIVKYKGESLTIAQWARRCGLKYQTLRRRIVNGWEVEKALTKGIKTSMININVRSMPK